MQSYLKIWIWLIYQAAGIAKRGVEIQCSRAMPVSFRLLRDCGIFATAVYSRLRYIFARLSADGGAVVGELQLGAVGELDFVAVAFLLQLDNLRA